MSLKQYISEDGRHKVTEDDMNPRCRCEEWKCHACGEWVDDDDVVWANEDGTLSTDTGNPYCMDCVPEEEI